MTRAIVGRTTLQDERRRVVCHTYRGARRVNSQRVNDTFPVRAHNAHYLLRTLFMFPFTPITAVFTPLCRKRQTRVFVLYFFMCTLLQGVKRDFTNICCRGIFRIRLFPSIFQRICKMYYKINYGITRPNRTDNDDDDASFGFNDMIGFE